MYIVLLRLASNKSKAPDHMAGHEAWIQEGIEDGGFLLVGSIQPGQGGAIVANDTTLEELQARVSKDPFVVHDIVTPEIIVITPNLTDPRLAFLAG